MKSDGVSQKKLQKIKYDIPSTNLKVKHALSYLATIRDNKVSSFKNSKFLYRMKDSIMEIFGFNTDRKIALEQFDRQCNEIVSRSHQQKASLTANKRFILEVNNVESSFKQDLNKLSSLFDFPPNDTQNTRQGINQQKQSGSADKSAMSAVKLNGNNPAADQDKKDLPSKPIVVSGASADNTISQGAISSDAPTVSISNKFTTSTIQYIGLNIQQDVRVFKMDADMEVKFHDRYGGSTLTLSMETKQKLWDESIATYIKDYDFSNDVTATINSINMTDKEFDAYLKMRFKPDWSLITSDPGFIPVDVAKDVVVVVFGNESLGGGVYGNGFVQEEQRVLLSPQIMHYIAILQKEDYKMNFNQSMLLEGAHSFVPDKKLYKNYYARNGIQRLSDDLNSGRIKATDLIPNKLIYETAVLSIHAKDHGKDSRQAVSKYEIREMLEQQVAAFAAVKAKGYKEIYTGALGAGAYRGNAKLALTVQMAAALLVGIPLRFFYCEQKDIDYATNKLKEMSDLMGNQELTLDLVIDWMADESEKDDALKVGKK